MLVYHRVGGRTGDPARELVPSHGTSLFDSQLGHLGARYRLVTEAGLLEAVMRRPRGGRFPVAVTFDDDLWSDVAVAMPLLRRHGAPATFFVCGASLERPSSFWWERLQAAVAVGVVDDEWLRQIAERAPATTPATLTDIHRAERAIESMSVEERERTDAHLRTLVGDATVTAGLRAEELETLARGGFDIGFHTLRHHRLPTLSATALAEAMVEGREQIERITGAPLRSIAYPHGRADHRVARAAREAGFERGFTTVAAPITPDTDPTLIGRYEPSFRSTRPLCSRARGGGLARPPGRRGPGRQGVAAGGRRRGAVAGGGQRVASRPDTKPRAVARELARASVPARGARTASARR